MDDTSTQDPGGTLKDLRRPADYSARGRDATSELDLLHGLSCCPERLCGGSAVMRALTDVIGFGDWDARLRQRVPACGCNAGPGDVA